MQQYRIKKGVDLFEVLPKYGFTYCGNYNRGENWVREQEGIDSLEPKNGIIIHGDWDGRKIFFKHPYRGTTDNTDICTFIEDLIRENLVDKINTVNCGDELISRNDTIKRLRAYADQKCATEEIELANGILKAACFIKDESNVPTANNMTNNGWIPCSERLPEKYGGYIAMIADAEKATSLYYSPDCSYWEDEWGNTYNVLAWQPYPAPYNPEAWQQTNAERIRTMTDEELADFLKPLVSKFTPIQDILSWLKGDANYE